MARQDFSVIGETEKLFPDAMNKEVVVSMRKVCSTDAAVRKESVPTEKFLKKCHVEHKRIGGVARDSTEFKLNACQDKVAARRSENVVHGKLLDLFS